MFDLKVDAQMRATFEAAGGAPFGFVSKRKPITTRYWSTPDEAMDSPDAMRPQWALQAALRKAALKSSGKRDTP